MHQSVLVTGASAGIGESIAIYLAHKGFRVFAGARRLDRVKALEGIAGKGAITALSLDVTDDDSVNAAMETISSHTDALYGLVNNAGIAVMGPVERVVLDAWQRQFETNVFGVVRMTQAVLPQMREAGRGRIVNIGSLTGRIALPFQGVYAASKHALEGMSDALRRETSSFGIKVSLVRPGYTNTSLGDSELEYLEPHMEPGEPYEDNVRAYSAFLRTQHPTGAEPGVVAEAVYDALTADRPKSRYTAPPSNMQYLAMRNLLPSAFLDKFIADRIGVKLKKK